MAIESRCQRDSFRSCAVRRRASNWWRFGASLFVVAVVATNSFAQQYQADDVDEAAGKLKLTAEQCVKNAQRFQQDGERFNEFFEKYYFPAMTRYSPDQLGQLGRMRDDLFNRFLWASNDEILQRELTQMAFKMLQPVERNKGKNYHPAVRYNAVLIIGMLDDKYPAPGQPQVPLKEGAAELTLIVNAAAEGKRVPPFLVVGALVGLQRHAQHIDKLDRATAEGLAAAVLKLSGKEVNLPETDTKVAEWIRVQAAMVLAKLGNPGANGEVAAAYKNMIAGETVPKMSLDGRVQVAALLQQLKLAGAKIDAKALGDALLELSVAVGDDEAKEAKAFTNLQIQSGGMGAYGGGSGKKSRMRFDAETQEWSLDKRVLLTRLTDLRNGLNAFKSNAPADQQPTIDAVVAAISPVITLAEGSETDIRVSGAVEQLAKNIRAAVKPGEPLPEDNDADLF
jgi:hypothetical protein